MRINPEIKLRILLTTGIVVMLAAFAVAGWWCNAQADQEKCSGLDVYITNADSSVFVTRQSIINELARLNINPINERISRINTQKIEQALNNSEYLENVECVIANNTKMQIRATQLVPVMRVFDGNASYYVNRKGKRMSATARYHVDVPVVSGHFTDAFPPVKLLPLIEYVENDELLSSLVTMYSMRDSNNVFIVPCINGHVVNIGHPDDLDNKFAKLREFYSKVMPAKGWLYYDTISLKYKHQIVATRRTKAVRSNFDWDAAGDDADADIQTMTVDDTTRLVAGSDERRNPLLNGQRPSSQSQPAKPSQQQPSGNKSDDNSSKKSDDNSSKKSDGNSSKKSDGISKEIPNKVQSAFKKNN